MGQQTVDTTSGKGFASLEVYENVLTLSSVFEQGRMERFFSPMTSYGQRKNYLKEKLKSRKRVLSERAQQVLYGTPVKTYDNMTEHLKKMMQMGNIQNALDTMVVYTLETYDEAKIDFVLKNYQKQYTKTKDPSVYDEFIFAFLGSKRKGRATIAPNMTHPKNLQWTGSGAMPLVGIKENPGDSFRVLSNLKKIGINVNNRWTRFEISNKEFVNKAEKVATINISFDDLIGYIQSSGDIIKNEIVKTYDLLNSLNSTVDLIFKEGDITRQTINKAKQDSQELADVTKSYEKSMVVVDR